MPGENLHKLKPLELKELRRIVRKVYGEQQGLSVAEAKQVYSNRECDALIDSLLPDTVERLKEIGIQSKWVKAKKFFLPSRILSFNGHAILKQDE